MKDTSGVAYPSKALWTLTALGGILLALLFAAVFFLTGPSATENSLIRTDLSHVRNDALGGQLVGMVFWSVFILLGGIIWSRTFFRKLSVIGVFTVAASIGLFLATILLVAASLLSAGDTTHEVALLIVGLLGFAVLGLLALIAREVIAAAFT